MATSEELAKNLETLSESIKSIQDKLATLERGATHSGADPQQSGSGTQYSSSDLAGLNPPPNKKARHEDEESNSDEEAEDIDASQGPLVTLSEAAAAFLEAVFSRKLDNNSRKAKAKANGTPFALDPMCQAGSRCISECLGGSKPGDR